jgi:hypothetical protein
MTTLLQIAETDDPALDDEARAFIDPSPAYGASEAPRARVQKGIGSARDHLARRLERVLLPM